MESKVKISVRNVSRTFAGAHREKIEALHDITFEVEDVYSDGRDVGEFSVLLGPSGCGKSTILRLVAGLDFPDQGQVLVNGQPVTGPGRDRGMVFQKYTSFPWLTVAENIAYGMKVNGVPEGERRETVNRLVQAVGLSGFEKAYPDTLSGGMQQRVAIARTLALRPQVVLMDEPFGALDAQTRSDMQQMVLDLWDEEKNTIIFVTHDISEALLLGDRVVVFSSRPAKIIYDEGDLDSVFGHKRPPDVVRMPEFVKRHEQLRQLLKKPHTGNGQHDEVG